jgi:hypothetical protein
MTFVTTASRRYRTMFTDNVNELSQKLGFDIGDRDFDATVEGETSNGNIRGYIHVPLFGAAMKRWGPITLHKSDLCYLDENHKYQLLK